MRHATSLMPLIPPVTVIWGSRAQRSFTLRARSSLKTPRSCRLELENGRSTTLRLSRISTEGDGRRLLEFKGAEIPHGYHRVVIESGGTLSESLLIAAPVRAYAEKPLRRRWGLFVPPYAIHSDQSWGAGDLSDLRTLGESLSGVGCGLLATLPLNATFLDEPFDPSPYSPASRLFWNEFYLHVPDIPEFASSRAAQKLVATATFQKSLKRLQRLKLVDYRAGMALKRRVLELLAREFFSRDSRLRPELDQFIKDRPEVVSYARFRAVTEQRRECWLQWPTRLRNGKIEPADFQRENEQYQIYVQWCAERQLGKLSTACEQRGVTVYLDVPLGVNAGSFDAWRNQDLFATGASVGAPPDAFFTKGQDWGLAPIDPRALQAQQYRYYIDFIRTQMRHTSLLRLDHVMGLHRLYWIPKGSPASEGAYIHYPAEEFYAILCLESHRHRTALVGENLGTVPPEVNRCMQRHGISEMYVVQYEPQPEAKEALRRPPRDCVASLNTHDMPTFTAFWNGLDIRDRCKLRLLSPKAAKAEKAIREKLKRALIRFLQRRRCLPRKGRYSDSDLFLACTRFLARSDARFVLVNIEDLWGETIPQNTPATTTERANWVRKLRYRLEKIISSKELRTMVEEISRERNR